MKQNIKRYYTIGSLGLVVFILIIAGFMTTAETVQMTAWSLLPPIIAIGLALVTKEVYSSLFMGILTGALLYSGFNFEGTINHIFSDGIISVLSDSYNVGILCFLVILGAMVQLMNKSGGSAAFGKWASSQIKTRAGAQLATIAFGCLIFIDDYFNCLTVGSVMRPVTDKHKVSRAKLAYLIDATAAPVCIIAPISSWAAAVSGFVEGENGMKLFLQTIPYNFYAVLTIVMMVMLVMFRVDYGPMRKHEINAIEKNDLFTTTDRAVETNPEENMRDDGHVLNMLVPIVSLIICCVIGMIYSGGFFSGTGFIDAFAGSDASVGLVLGSASALVITIVFYMIGNVLSFDECMSSLPDGFKAMIAPILILTFAWSLKAMTDSLGAKEFVAAVVEHSAANYLSFLPFIIFLISIGLSFATGTSWGTFGILIPIVVACFEGIDHTMMIIAMSACMAGAVCGDHCSPISDTTIMSSAGAQCVHINHVYTQLPYALTAAAISALAYIVAGITKSAVISLIVGAIAIAAVLFMIRSKTGIEKE
ncbi:MAG: Na+/H+ antiporter NhaC family protein [Oribacterium sp.]|nr:Na+/H+ antiporter NhaC family protein [Oribacterium sp.]MBP3806301.1 Na+/H+ antiporter NhaC family protein [Oribacterium sp.]MBR1856425.1 Na+/H+ antiporter NhaC family protein [Oribacterium sp.]